MTDSVWNQSGVNPQFAATRSVLETYETKLKGEFALREGTREARIAKHAPTFEELTGTLTEMHKKLSELPVEEARDAYKLIEPLLQNLTTKAQPIQSRGGGTKFQTFRKAFADIMQYGAETFSTSHPTEFARHQQALQDFDAAVAAITTAPYAGAERGTTTLTGPRDITASATHLTAAGQHNVLVRGGPQGRPMEEHIPEFFDDKLAQGAGGTQETQGARTKARATSV
jgi:hypothetical protein